MVAFRDRPISANDYITVVQGLNAVVTLPGKIQMPRVTTVIEVALVPHLQQDVAGTVDCHGRTVRIRRIDDVLTDRRAPAECMIMAPIIIGFADHHAVLIDRLQYSTATQAYRVRPRIAPVNRISPCPAFRNPLADDHAR